jgi:hypothetical protein
MKNFVSVWVTVPLQGRTWNREAEFFNQVMALSGLLFASKIYSCLELNIIDGIIGIAIVISPNVYKELLVSSPSDMNSICIAEQKCRRSYRYHLFRATLNQNPCRMAHYRDDGWSEPCIMIFIVADDDLMMLLSSTSAVSEGALSSCPMRVFNKIVSNN